MERGRAALLETALIVLGVITFILLLGYLFYGGLYRTFLRVGFTRGEVSLILLGTFVGGLLDIPLFRVGDWRLAINVGGAIVPIVVTFLLLRRRPSVTVEVLAATTMVTIATYLVTSVTEDGIASPFPLYLVPPVVAAGLSLGAFWREEDFAAPLAYMGGTLGAIVGADLLRLPEFLASTPPAGSTGFASIGGAAVFDMVYLTGVIAVLLDGLFFSQVHRWRAKHAVIGYEEGPVFTTSTPSEVISAYTPKLPEAPRRREPEAPRRSTPTPAPASPPPYAPPGAPSQDPRVAKHREWEERLRSKRSS